MAKISEKVMDNLRASTWWIIYNPRSSLPPSRIYGEQAEANKISQKMAARYKQTFFVMQCVGFAELPVAPFYHNGGSKLPLAVDLANKATPGEEPPKYIETGAAPSVLRAGQVGHATALSGFTEQDDFG
jgi:hypothetical protein